MESKQTKLIDAQAFSARRESAHSPIKFTMLGEPVAWARAGRNGNTTYTSAKQRSYMHSIYMHCLSARHGFGRLDGAIKLSIHAIYVKPPSWSKMKARETQFKTTPSDLDNLVKIVGDSLNGSAYFDDAQIVWIDARKSYGERAQLVVWIEEIEPNLTGAFRG